jgi:hypothetical protein
MLNLFGIALLSLAIDPDLLMVIIHEPNFRDAGFAVGLALLAQIVSVGALRKNLHNKIGRVCQGFG